MKRLTMLGVIAMATAVFAGSAASDGTDFVITAGSGESYTNTADFASATRLVKRGAGEVVLNTSSSFAGSVVVEA